MVQKRSALTIISRLAELLSGNFPLMFVTDRWLYMQKQLIARCDQQTMDIGVEHFSLTRYIPPTGNHNCPYAMAHLSRATAGLCAAKGVDAAVTNTKKGVYPCE
jgi:hypothetical protein